MRVIQILTGLLLVAFMLQACQNNTEEASSDEESKPQTVIVKKAEMY